MVRLHNVAVPLAALQVAELGVLAEPLQAAAEPLRGLGAPPLEELAVLEADAPVRLAVQLWAGSVGAHLVALAPVAQLVWPQWGRPVLEASAAV